MYTNTRSLTPPVSARAHPILTPNDTATPTPATPRPSHPHPQWREPTPPYSNKVALNSKCPNAALRVGPSVELPDCRAYELVTPESLGGTEDLAFNGFDRAIPSVEGERLALQAGITALEPDPNAAGTDAVFSRTAEGWRMTSDVAPGTGGQGLFVRLLSPELSQVGLEAARKVNAVESSPITFEFGPIGGPYTPAASVPPEFVGGSNETGLLAANGGTADIAPFSDVAFVSTDHKISLSSAAEQSVAEETLAGVPNLYDWVNGAPRLVNVEGEGPQVKLVGKCGAIAGEFFSGEGPGAVGAVSADGSKIFFTSPTALGEQICQEPRRLYMRVGGERTVEISKPTPGVELKTSERSTVRYDVASPDGSEVLFNTATPLTAGETPLEKSENKLFMYNTVTNRLTLIASGVSATEGTGNRFVLVSEDGSTVYYTVSERIYRYNVANGTTSLVAVISTPDLYDEQSYVTPNGQFLLFVSGPGGVEGEPRGQGHNELLPLRRARWERHLRVLWRRCRP